jgi:uncharacterized protein DUF6152
MSMKMTIRAGGVLAGAAFLLWAMPVLAHHSFAAQYDASKPVEMKGVVTQVDWTNPHARFYIDVKNDRGEVTSWNFEIASPNVLVRNGWKRNTLKIGDEITVSGYLGRSGPPSGPRMAIAGGVTAADGRKLFASSAADLAR